MNLIFFYRCNYSPNLIAEVKCLYIHFKVVCIFFCKNIITGANFIFIIINRNSTSFIERFTKMGNRFKFKEAYTTTIYFLSSFIINKFRFYKKRHCKATGSCNTRRFQPYRNITLLMIYKVFLLQNTGF